MTRSARVRIAAAAIVALGALAGLVVLVVHVRADESGVGHLNFATPSPAVSPFADFSQAHVAVGDRCLNLLVALTPDQRVQGLREVRSLGPYAGMLFVNRGDSTARFTMADTVVPLDVTFFSGAGVALDSARMVPCPAGTDATCPQYASHKPYRYALEQVPGSASASGSLGSCG